MAESFEYIRYIGFCKTAAQPILNIFRSGNLNFVTHAVNLIFDPGMKELTILPEVIFVIHRADNEFEIQQMICVEPC